jgi:catechol 2,3-dioxygenase-like lactoylglutathione lyase family enzyme
MQLDHLILPVNDLEKSVTFYTAMLASNTQERASPSRSFE